MRGGAFMSAFIMWMCISLCVYKADSTVRQISGNHLPAKNLVEGPLVGVGSHAVTGHRAVTVTAVQQGHLQRLQHALDLLNCSAKITLHCYPQRRDHIGLSVCCILHLILTGFSVVRFFLGAHMQYMQVDSIMLSSNDFVM